MMESSDPGALWRPSCSLLALQTRARLLASLRAFFAERDVLEVETPVLAHHAVTDVHISAVEAKMHLGRPDVGEAYWLQTSPEYHMKRLLAAGSGSIYQVFRAFRDGERGARHNPEFSLLEWYRVGFDHLSLMDEVRALVEALLGPRQWLPLSYRDLFKRFLGLDPVEVSDDVLAERGAQVSGLAASSLDRDGALDLLLTHVIEPALKELDAVFVHSYPPSQAALARTDKVDGVEVAHRFELYIGGMELCNGYWELTDSAEQARRFSEDNRQRRLRGLPPMSVDPWFMAALQQGLPDCAGVALGLDRLLMLMLQAAKLEEVVTFPVARA